MAWFGPGFLLPQDSHPASGDLTSSVPIEVFLSRRHVDMEGFLEWQFSMVFSLIHHCGLFPCDRVVILPSTYVLLLLTSQHPSLAGIPVLLQSGLKSSLGLTNVGLATAAGDPVHHLGLLLHQQGVLHFGQHQAGDGPDLKITCML